MKFIGQVFMLIFGAIGAVIAFIVGLAVLAFVVAVIGAVLFGVITVAFG